LIFVVLIGLWGSSYFFKPVKQLIEEAPVVETTIDTTIVAPIPLPKPEPLVKPADPSIYVQFGSFRTKESAWHTAKQLEPIYGGLEVRKAKLPNGVWYRIVKPFADLGKAKAVCAETKASGRDCIVLQF
jgi:cell division protein FtsN